MSTDAISCCEGVLFKIHAFRRGNLQSIDSSTTIASIKGEY